MTVRYLFLSAALAAIAADSFAETHTVTFRRLNGTILQKVEVEHGGSVEPPEAPQEANFSFKSWEHADWLGCVTNDVNSWALYENDGSKTWPAGTGYGSKSIADREEAYTIEEYFKMYDNVAWTDEFSRGSNTAVAVNGSYWNYDTEDRHQLSYETSGGNQVESNGFLTITVRREHAVRSSWWGGTTEYDFTGGGIKSNGKVAFKYGRCEIRAKLTRQRGAWPAFWMMGNTGNWPQCGELDILEQPSGGDWVAGTFHIDMPNAWARSIGNGHTTDPKDGVHWGDGFHRFGAIINEREIVWYVDDNIFKRMDVRDSRYDMVRDRPWFIIFGMGLQSNTWVTAEGDVPRTKDDVPELTERGVDFLVDYCRIYTNTNESNTVSYEAPEATAKLSSPVNATVWRGWDMAWGRAGASAYQNNISKGYGERYYIKTALTEYFGREKTDVLMFLTDPTIATSENKAQFDIPGYTMMSLSANANGWNDYDNANNGLGRIPYFSSILYNRDRFSMSDSCVGIVTLSDDPAFTNCYAICADLKEKSTGARVKVIGVNVVTTNGVDEAGGTAAQGFSTLFAKLNAIKDENVILFISGMDWSKWNYLRQRAGSELAQEYTRLGDHSAWPTYQSVYATANLGASASTPQPVAVPRDPPSISYPHSPQALQTTVTFDELPSDGLSDTFNASDYLKTLEVAFPGYSGSSTLENFPVLVKLSTAISGFSYADFALENGGDLRFRDAGGNLIPHEIDTWNTNGVSTVWVRVPSLTASAKITAHYGCAVPVRPCADSVWDSDYVGLWHLGEGSLPLRESSGVSSDFAYSTGKTVAYGSEGIVGGAVDMANGASNSVVAVDHDELDGFTQFTVEAWTQQDSHKLNAGILSKRAGYGNEMSYYMLDVNAKTKLCVSTNGTSTVESTLLSPVAGGDWQHQVYSLDTTTTSSNLKGYLNGAQSGTASKDVGNIYAGKGNLILGNLNANAKDNVFNGRIDEVRISKCARSADWIKATYDTIAGNDSFASYAMAGPVEPFDVVAFARKMQVTFSGYYGSGALANFPVLVRLSTAIVGFSYDDFLLSDGGDLRFTDSGGNLVPHEIDTWNTNGVSTVWVRVPSLTSSATLTAHYGSATPGEPSSEKVWDSDYVGVWHLGESALPMKESSGTSSDFTESSGNGIGFASEGIVGGAVDFGASGNSRALIASDHDALDGFPQCTIEAWTYVDSSYRKTGNDVNKALLSKRINYNNQSSYYLFDTGASTSFYVSQNGTSSTYMSGSVQADADAWTHQAYTFDGSTANNNVEGWKNGLSAGKTSKSLTSVYAGSGNLYLGSFGPSGNSADARNFPGSVDEVRISKVVRSADWIKATHDTVAYAAFATYVVEGFEPQESDRILYVDVPPNVTTSLDASLVTSYITNIVKRGAGTLVATSVPGYAVDFTIENGVYVFANAGDFGATGSGVIDVKDGASLQFTGDADNVLSGKTINLYGAKSPAANAKIVFSNSDARNLGTEITVCLKNADEVFSIGSGYVYLSSGTVDLGGHELRIKGTGRWMRFEIGATVVNGGSLVFDKSQLHVLGSRKPVFSPDCAATASLKFVNGAEFNCKEIVPSNGWTLHGDASFVHGNINRFPGMTNYPAWDGPVVFSGSSLVADWTGGYNVSNTVFNLKGEVSGSGELTVGPGWLNLHNASNVYSGAVTVRGQWLESTTMLFTPILPGSGGIGLWNGATCFTNASSVTFTDSARLEFMDETRCVVGANVVFAGGEGDVQSVSGGVHTARSVMGGFTKTGAGTLVFDSPVEVMGRGEVQAGTLKVANRFYSNAQSPVEMLARQTVFSNLAFAAGTVLDLSGNAAFRVADLAGAPAVTNAGIFGVTGCWTLNAPGEVLTVAGDGVTFGDEDVSGSFGFLSGARFAFADEAAFSNAVASAGSAGIVVARANRVLVDTALNGLPMELPQPAAGASSRWTMFLADGDNGVTELRLKLAPASGYAAWIAEKGIEGAPADKTNGLENGVRYAFDIAPENGPTEIGEPIIKVVFGADGNPGVHSRNLAENRDDVTFGVLATETLGDWSSGVLIPMKQFSDGLWKPTESENSSYVFPPRMFFKYRIDVD